MKSRKKNKFFYKATAAALSVSLALAPSYEAFALGSGTKQNWRDAVRAGEAASEEGIWEA